MEKPNDLKPMQRGEVKKIERLGVLDLLFAGDIRTAFKEAIKTVFIPRLQDMMNNFSQSVISSFIYGEGYKAPDNSRPQQIQYNKQFTQQGNTQYNVKPSDRLDITNYVFTSYSRAVEALNYLKQCAHQGQVVTLLHFYDYVGETTLQTDGDHGWTSATILNTQMPTKNPSNGWYIKLPKAIPIEK